MDLFFLRNGGQIAFAEHSGDSEIHGKIAIRGIRFRNGRMNSITSCETQWRCATSGFMALPQNLTRQGLACSSAGTFPSSLAGRGEARARAQPASRTDYLARFTCPEFTSLCPVTGQPDFGILVIDYVPGDGSRNQIAEALSRQLPQPRCLSRGLHGGDRQDDRRSWSRRAIFASAAIGIREAAFRSTCSGRPGSPPGPVAPRSGHPALSCSRVVRRRARRSLTTTARSFSQTLDAEGVRPRTSRAGGFDAHQAPVRPSSPRRRR